MTDPTPVGDPGSPVEALADWWQRDAMPDDYAALGAEKVRGACLAAGADIVAALTAAGYEIRPVGDPGPPSRNQIESIRAWVTPTGIAENAPVPTRVLVQALAVIDAIRPVGDPEGGRLSERKALLKARRWVAEVQWAGWVGYDSWRQQKDAAVAAIDAALASPAPDPGPEPLSVEQAAWVNRPADRAPWEWSEPIGVLVSDSHKWGTEWEQTLGICEDAIRRLYEAGYRLLPPGPADPGDRPENDVTEERR